MRVRLIYEYEITEEDGVGTHNDAYISAIRAMDRERSGAPSTEDEINVFRVELLAE